MVNPYRNTVIDTKKKEPFAIGRTKLPGQANAFTDNKGEINASNTADLLMQIGNAMKANETGAFVKASAADSSEKIRERNQVLIEAMNDHSGKSMQVLGEAFAAEVDETTMREGLVRRFMQFRNIGQGENNEVIVREKNILGFIATSPSVVMASEIRQRRILPPEFHINGYVLIDTAEIGRFPGDLLGEKYEEALEATMVAEDRCWKNMAFQAAPVRNTIQNFSTFTPAVLARLINQVSRWGIPAVNCYLSATLMPDIASNTDFSGVMDPVTKWELLQDGYLGVIYGVTITTDSFRQPTLKVLNPGEIFIIGAPINHGIFTVRGSMDVEPINRYSEGEAKKGWFLDQVCSMVLANAQSIAYGIKV